jgi:methylenetetrahydrofolate--tRNA-(uracil-5-)-methyltransferase
MLGGLVRYLASANPDNFQPMNANWGLVPSEGGRGKKTEKRMRMFRRGLEDFLLWLAQTSSSDWGRLEEMSSVGIRAGQG